MLHYQRKKILEHFKCQQSGNCCRCEGYVYPSFDDQKKMAARLNMTLSEFLHRHTRMYKGHRVLATPDFQTQCMLDDQNSCRVYEARPDACRTYPDWDVIWASEESLQGEIKLCPGLKKAVAYFCADK